MSNSPNPSHANALFIARLEEGLRTLLEDRLTNLLEGGIKPATLIRKLARILQSAARSAPPDTVMADHLTIHLNPQDFEQINRLYPNLAAQLTAQLTVLAQEARISLVRELPVRLAADPSLALHRTRIKVQYVEVIRERTQGMPAVRDTTPLDPPSPTPASLGRHAYLVLYGEKPVPLDKTVVNIGRHPDNHIVLDEPSISRHHCQIRLRFGHYVLYDLQSKRGTFVNNLRIREHRLQRGDVISLAGIKMVYAEDEDPKSSERDTQTRSPLQGIFPSSEQAPNDRDPTL